MNKIYNSWTIIFSMAALFFGYLISLNEKFGIYPRLEGIAQDLHFMDYFYGGAAVLILLLNLRRSVKKWSGMKLVNQTEKFQFTTGISESRRKTVILNNFLEITAFFILSFAFVVVSVKGTIVTLVFYLIIIDMLVNTIRGLKGKKYRIGMTKKAIVAVDREVLPIYFKGLKHVTKQGTNIYFEYVNDLVLYLNLDNIPAENQEEFVAKLREFAGEDTVYFSGF